MGLGGRLTELWETVSGSVLMKRQSPQGVEVGWREKPLHMGCYRTSIKFGESIMRDREDRENCLAPSQPSVVMGNP